MKRRTAPSERVGVEFGQHAVDAGLRRRNQPPRGRAAERPRRGQLALRQPGGELGDGGRPLRPRQLGRRRQRRHRRQRMPQAAPPPALRHLAQEVVQTAQPRRRGRPGRRTRRRQRRRLVGPAQRLRRARRQRSDEHPLRPSVRHPAAARLRVAPRLAQLDPVRRPVARALEARRIHERLRQKRRMPQRRLHVRRQPPQRQRQHPRRQVRRPRVRQDQEPRVVRHQPQAPELLLRRPADPGVADLHLERAALPARQRQPATVRRRRHMPHPAAEQAPEPQIVVRVHQPIPLRALRAASRRTHRHLRQRDVRPRTPRHDLSASSNNRGHAEPSERECPVRFASPFHSTT